MIKHIRAGRVAVIWLVVVGVLVLAGAGSVLVFGLRWGALPSSEPPKPSEPLLSGSPTANPADDSPNKLQTAEALQQEGLDVCRQALDDFPGSIGPIILMGKFHDQFGNRSEAVRWWGKALERNPKRPADIYFRLAAAAAKNGDYEQTVELCQKARRSGGPMLSVHRQLARAFLELGKAQDAIDILRETVMSYPGDPASHAILGEAYLQLRQYDRAVLNYEKTLTLAPNDSRACYGLTIALTRSGNTEKARQHQEQFRQIRAAASESVKVNRKTRNHVEWTRQAVSLICMDAAVVAYLKHQQLPQAEKLFKRAAVLDPKNQPCRQRLAKLYMKQRRFADAVETCRQLCRLNPNNATYFLNTAQILGRLKRLEAAGEALQKADELAPGHASVQRVRRYLQSLSEYSKARELK
jgi:tetratricopeptide (TPR) repeat protein